MYAQIESLENPIYQVGAWISSPFYFYERKIYGSYDVPKDAEGKILGKVLEHPTQEEIDSVSQKEDGVVTHVLKFNLELEKWEKIPNPELETQKETFRLDKQAKKRQERNALLSQNDTLQIILDRQIRLGEDITYNQENLDQYAKYLCDFPSPDDSGWENQPILSIDDFIVQGSS